jgi:hypothetical protein
MSHDHRDEFVERRKPSPSCASLQALHDAIPSIVREAVRDTMPGLLSEDERRWVKLAIEREAQSIKLRQAIIEKTLGSLLWAAIAGAGLVLLDYLRSHGMRF